MKSLRFVGIFSCFVFFLQFLQAITLIRNFLFASLVDILIQKRVSSYGKNLLPLEQIFSKKKADFHCQGR